MLRVLVELWIDMGVPYRLLEPLMPQGDFPVAIWTNAEEIRSGVFARKFNDARWHYFRNVKVNGRNYTWVN